ncbi:MAG TPA: DUF4198 domain-containing protein, partial [Acidobacteriota bacterium]
NRFSIIFMLYAGVVSAHDLYLWPQPVVLNKPEKASLALYLQKEKIVWFESMTVGLRLIGPSGEATLSLPQEGDPVVSFDLPGTYIVGWESEPLFVKIDPPIFQKYLSVEGFRNVLASRKQSGAEEKPGLEIYRRYLKSFIQIGETQSDHYKEKFGFKIEIVPLTNPYSLKVASDFAVQVFFDGEPLRNHRIMGTYNSYSDIPEDYAQVTATDSNGVAVFRITHPGFWLVRTVELLPLQDHADAEWQSFWANCTFEVKKTQRHEDTK